MPRLVIVHDPRDGTGADLSAALARWAAGDFDVVVVSADAVSAPDINADAVLLAPGVDPVRLAAQLRDGGYAGPLAAVWPHSWPRQLEEFHALYRVADAVIVNDAVYWGRLGRLPRTQRIAPAVELEGGDPATTPAERTPRVLLARDPARGQARGADRWLDEEALWFLRDLGIPVAAPADVAEAADLRAWLQTGSVVVCWDDDAQSRRVLLAAAVCGCAVVCTQTANIDGLIEGGVSGQLAGAEPAALRGAVEQALLRPAQLADDLRQGLGAWSWERRAPEYFSLLRNLLRGRPDAAASSAPGLDLSREVTVFVTTVGAPSYAACVDHLSAQDCSFTVQVIDHVAPMSAAFQRMLDACATPFYVQVDEDMLLYPHAVRTLVERIRVAPPDVALVVGCLLDAHLDTPVLGVKIFRHAIAVQYPFENAHSFEISQLERMWPDGYRYEVLPRSADWRTSAVAGGMLGLHGTHWTPRAIFERYATYERSRHRLPKHHRAVREWTGLFLERVMTSGSELDLFALMGVIAARLAHADSNGAKDFRRYEGLAGVAGIRAFLDELDRRVD